MRRAIVVVTIIHFLLALLLAGTAVIVVWQIRTPEIAKEPDAVRGLIIGATVVAGPAVLLMIGTCGLWKRRRWGWWTALLTDIAVLATLVYSAISENSIDQEEVACAIVFAVVCVVLLLPVVRKSCVGEGAQAVSS